MIAAALVAIPWLFLAVQLWAFLSSRTAGDAVPAPGIAATDPAFVVLIPAHNEEEVIGPVIKDLMQSAPGNARILVVADNCDDDTAGIAAEAGAEVIVREDKSRVGKSYALEYGVRHLAEDPPAAVVAVDADCSVGSTVLADLAAACISLKRPVQARYLLGAPEAPNPGYRVAEFAIRLKNWFRPAGLHAMGLPCQLMGTGMAFPWQALMDAEIASGSIVEDMTLGLDLANKGHAPVFLETAHVVSTFPQTDAAAISQRTRWEHGHIWTILSLAPRYLMSAVWRRNLPLLAMVVDLLIPPLALFSVLTAVLGVAAYFSWTAGGPVTALAVLCLAVGLCVILLSIVWFRFARDILPWSKVWLVPIYIVRKLPMYLLALFRPERNWVKTNRNRP